MQIVYLVLVALLIVFLAMLLEIKKAYEKEDFLQKQRQELLNQSQNQLTPDNPSVFDESFSQKDSCKESWFCTDWTDCRSNIQKRACLDMNNCKTTLKKPEIEQQC